MFDTLFSRIAALCIPTLVALAPVAFPAAAQDVPTQSKLCGDDQAAPDPRIAACTWLIQSGQLTGSDLGTIYLVRGNIVMYFNGDADAALADYNEAVRLLPYDAAPYVVRATLYEYKARFDDALADYGQAIRLEPAHFYAYTKRAHLYVKVDRPEAAIDDYGQAIDIDPTDERSYIERAQLYARIGEPEHAADDNTKAIELNPRNAFPYFNRAGNYFRLDRIDDALDDLFKTIELEPQYQPAYYALASVRAAYRDPQYRNGAEAVQLALRALSLKSDENTIGVLAYAYVENNEPEKALATYLALLKQGGAVLTRRYQADLTARGFYRGKIDGAMSPALEAALKDCVAAGCKVLSD